MRAGTPRFVLLAALIPLLLLAPLPDAGAAEDATTEIDREALVKDRRQKASRNPVSTRVSRYLNAAAEAVDEEDPQEAKRLLHRLDMRGLNRYERVLIYRMLAYVSYGANDRLFGPFRLHPGRLDESERLTDDATLDALERSLLRPPDPGIPGSDFGSIVHTLNDLYLRGYAGQVQLVWITDGWSAAGIPQFQPHLWPKRVEQLNPEWSENAQAGVLAALDAGLGLQDAELSRFIASMPPDEPDRAGRILRFLQALDREATRTLHPVLSENSIEPKSGKF